MALKRNETYPGRFDNPTTAHPQGAFKNRSAPGAQDGSYLEQQWANDHDGFFARIINLSGITLSGVVDTGVSSQLFDGLFSLLSPGRFIGVQQFTASGTYTPTAGCKSALVELVGGGGGGGGCFLTSAGSSSAGGGGGSGGYSRSIITNPVSTVVTIGTGGTAGTVANPPVAGSNGGVTSFGSLVIANGGNVGLNAGWAITSSSSACTDGGGGGTPGTGTLAICGNLGTRGQQLQTNGSGGSGANSQLGSGGHYRAGVGSTFNPPSFGGGGAGQYRADTTTYSGSAGASGICLVWEYF